MTVIEIGLADPLLIGHLFFLDLPFYLRPPVWVWHPHMSQMNLLLWTYNLALYWTQGVLTFVEHITSIFYAFRFLDHILIFGPLFFGPIWTLDSPSSRSFMTLSRTILTIIPDFAWTLDFNPPNYFGHWTQWTSHTYTIDIIHHPHYC